MSATEVLDDRLSSFRRDAKPKTSAFAIETTRDFETADLAWAELEAAGSAFQSRHWLAPWFRFVAPSVGAQPYFVTVRDRETGRPLVFFPFCLRRSWGVNVVEFPDFGVSDYNAPICAPEFEFTDQQFATLWAEVRLAVPGADIFVLEKVPEKLYGRSVAFARLAFMQPMDLRCWTIELPASRELYDKTVLRAKDRKEQRRKRRNLVEKLGEPKLVEAAAREQALKVFEMLKRMRAERFRQQGRRDILAEAQFAPFYEELASRGPPEFVSLASIGSDETPIAALMALRHADNYVLIMHSFATDHEQLSPGIVALDALMTHLIEGGTHHCDFTTGNEPYKKQFGVVEQAMRHGCDCVTAQGRLFGALLQQKKKIRCALVKYLGKYAKFLRRWWPISRPC